MEDPTDGKFDPDFSSCSVQSLLDVPLRVIMREAETGEQGRHGGAGSNPKNYVFSKSEVSTLLRVSMLSSELDALLSLAYDALDRSHKCQKFSKEIEESNKQAASGNRTGIYLRALLPALNVHADTAESALGAVTCETFGIGRILRDLEACAEDLEKSLEQNHNMADQLDGYMAPGRPGRQNTLASEKRAIAEIEEAVVERVRSLDGLAGGASVEETPRHGESPPSINALFENGATNAFTPMSDVCEVLFAKHKLTTNIAPP